MPIYLEGIAAQFYRGIGPETQYIAPFSDMNFFVGANNAGKSVVLNLIKDRLPFRMAVSRHEAALDGVEEYRGAKTAAFAVAVGISSHVFVGNLARHYFKGGGDESSLVPAPLIAASSYFENDGFVWLTKEPGSTPQLWRKAGPGQAAFERDTQLHYTLAHQMDLQWNNVPRQFRAAKTLDGLLAAQDTKLPAAFMIPAKRELGPKAEAFDDLSGKGLIDHLATMQNPDHHERENREIFDQINDFVQSVIGKSDAKLEVPSERQHLLVHMDNKVLPLASLGTGIHEVILIAAFCTIHQEKIMCIEEPEIHLHPVLQRKLIQYLQENTKNQYFIATHSAAFIDTPGASVFHVRNDGVQTYVTCAVKPGDKRKITDELGYRASDILQSNAVIWVEGPSDRIYIKHWLEAVNAELKEGIHYTIMFYGGGLISHLSADEDALEQFIRLRRLNQNMAIVIDSDREHSRASLKPAAQRLRAEMADAEGLVWITQGREIENYVDADRLHDALKRLHPHIYGGRSAVGRYDHAFHFKRKSPKAGQTAICTEADKVGVATSVCDEQADLSILDLKKQITALAKMIEKAQGV